MNMALKKNKVKFGLNKVHWAKITAWSDDGVPTFATPVRLPGAVSLSVDASGGADNFYADNGVYYVINNNSGYEGDLEVALITTDFATEILGEQLDSKGVLVERNDAELAQFALLFEFEGDKNKIRHVLYCCSASRPATESSTTEEETEVKTETLSLKATALPSGLVKSKTCENTDETTYNNWYNAVYIPTAATTNSTTNTRSASTTKSAAAAATD
jgi:phi13 family phage major tail protein